MLNEYGKMQKITIILCLVTSYVVYSFWVYTYGTSGTANMSANATRGKALWQQKNCQNCHQIFGLGGYMGPDLTNIISDPRRGSLYAKGIISAGGNRMPNFHFTPGEAEDLIAWLEYTDHASKTTTR